MRGRLFGMNRRGFLAALAGSACCHSLAVAGTAASDGDAPILTFGLVADAQYRDCEPAGTRFYRNSLDKVRACVADLNAQKPAFVIHLGDLIDHDFASYEAILAEYAGLTMPHYHVLGNHDFSVTDEEKGKLTEVLAIPSRYYSFEQGSCRFVVLDGNGLSLQGTLANSAERAEAEAMLKQLSDAKVGNAQPWNGALGADQMSWLEETLAEADQTGQKTVLFCHFPVYPANVHNLWDDREVVGLIERHPCVVAYINGHNHAGNYAEKSGIHYLTLRGMVETADSTAYALASVYANRIVIEGSGREPDRVLRIGRV